MRLPSIRRSGRLDGPLSARWCAVGAIEEASDKVESLERRRAREEAIAVK